MRRFVGPALQVVGAAVLAVGGFLVAPFVGVVVAGAALVAFGVALERGE